MRSDTDRAAQDNDLVTGTSTYRLSTKELYQLGYDHLIEGNSDSAITYLTILVARYGRHTPAEEQQIFADAYYELGVAYYNQKDLGNAYRSFKMAQKVAPEPSAKALNGLAGVYTYYGDLQRAVGYLQQAFDAAARSLDYRTADFALLNLISSAVATEHIDTVAPQLALHATLKPPTSKEPAGHAYTITMRRAAERLIKGDRDEAVALMKVALTQVDTLGLPLVQRTSALENIGKVFRTAGINDSALAYMHQASTVAKHGGMRDVEAYLNHQMAMIYDQMGNPASARACRVRYVELSDSTFNANELDQIHSIELNQRVGDYERQIAAMRLRDSYRATTIIIVGVALALVLVLLVMLWLKNRKLTAANAALYQQWAPKPSVAAVPKETAQTAEQMEQLMTKIKEAMDAPERPWLNPDFGLPELTRMVGSNAKYVSEAINTLTGRNFAAFVNERRIAEATRLMAGEGARLTIESIAQQVGFRSRSNFSVTFKQTTGMTPAQFVKFSQSEQ